MNSQTATEAAPGVPWPALGIVAVLDTSTVPAKLRVVHSSEIKYNSHAAGNFARSMVYAGPKAAVEVKGEHASLSVPNASATLFVRLTEDTDTQLRHLTLLRLQPVKDGREAAQFTQNIFGGSKKRIDEVIAITKSNVEDSAWVKVTPSKPLEDGEYAIAFLPEVVVGFPNVVYDFTVASK